MVGLPARISRYMSSTDSNLSLMRFTIPLLLALCVPALAGTRLVPAFAQHVPGANQSFWQSELRLFNPSVQPASRTCTNAPGAIVIGEKPVHVLALYAKTFDTVTVEGCAVGLKSRNSDCQND